MRRCFVCGNWKMNKTPSEGAALARELRGAVSMVRDRVEIAVAPAFTALYPEVKALEGSYKTVVCSATSCSPPLKGSWAAK